MKICDVTMTVRAMALSLSIATPLLSTKDSATFFFFKKKGVIVLPIVCSCSSDIWDQDVRVQGLRWHACQAPRQPWFGTYGIRKPDGSYKTRNCHVCASTDLEPFTRYSTAFWVNIHYKQARLQVPFANGKQDVWSQSTGDGLRSFRDETIAELVIWYGRAPTFYFKKKTTAELPGSVLSYWWHRYNPAAGGRRWCRMTLWQHFVHKVYPTGFINHRRLIWHLAI